MRGELRIRFADWVSENEVRAATGLIEVIDNITFDVEDIRTPGVPEPASALLVAAATALLARRRTHAS